MLTRVREGTSEAAGENRSDREPGGAISIRGLEHAFGDLRVIDRIDVEAAPGEVLGIVGPSGSGKTTLLELVAGLHPPGGGEVEVAGRTESEARLDRCAYMPQRDLLLPWLSAIDNASLAPRLAGASRAEARRRAESHFERLGLSGFEHVHPGELSGGMRQRVAFLRTLMAGRPVLLLDEPFASLDAITRADLQSWLAGILEPDRHTVLLVTHDVEEAIYLADRVIVLSSRPATVATELEVPDPRSPDRAAAVTSAEFGELRQRALRSLAEGRT